MGAEAKTTVLIRANAHVDEAVLDTGDVVTKTAPVVLSAKDAKRLLALHPYLAATVKD